MENASKALLIAAAVLIVVLLIAFGVSVFNNAKTAVDTDEATGSISSGISQGASIFKSDVASALSGL